MPSRTAPTTHKFSVYQLLVRLFGNGNPAPVPNGDLRTNGCGKWEDLNTAALESIRSLGIDAIWLTGILRHATQTDYSAEGIPASHPSTVKGKAGSPYAISDFFDLDPDISTHPAQRWEEFLAACDRIHAAGMKVIIDFIPNHTARQYHSLEARKSGLRDLGENDRTDVAFDPQNHYYYFPGQPLVLPGNQPDAAGQFYEEFPAKATGNDCFSPTPSEFDWYETVKLNYGRDYASGQNFFDPPPPTWIYMKEVLRFWAGKKVDGFRCDMAELVPVEFWNWVIPQIQQEFPGIRFIAEVYNPDLYRRYLEEGKFDYLYDKVGLYDALRALVEGRGDAGTLTQVWKSQEGFSERMLRFMENHDEQRIASDRVGRDPFRALPAMAVSACMGKGPVMVYSGQELGEKAEGSSGFSGDDGKTSIFDYTSLPTVVEWNQHGKWEAGRLPEKTGILRKAYQEILQFSRPSPAIASGSFFDLQYANAENPQYDSRKTFSFLRYNEQEQILAVAGFSNHPAGVKIRIPIEVWGYMGLPSHGRCRLEDVFGNNPDLEFYIESSYESDGGTAGISIPLPAFGYRILRFRPL